MKIKKITTSAMMVALAAVLMFVSKIIPSPWLQGGSITLASMVPIIAVSIMYGTKWGIISGFCYSLIQLMSGFYVPPVSDFLSYTIVILFDYVVAFSILGTAHIFYSLFGKNNIAVTISGITVVFFRYLCHIFTGIVIWGVYAPEGQSVLWYSIAYNGSYMIPEIIISGVVLSLMSSQIHQH